MGGLSDDFWPWTATISFRPRLQNCGDRGQWPGRALLCGDSHVGYDRVRGPVDEQERDGANGVASTWERVIIPGHGCEGRDAPSKPTREEANHATAIGKAGRIDALGIYAPVPLQVIEDLLHEREFVDTFIHGASTCPEGLPIEQEALWVDSQEVLLLCQGIQSKASLQACRGAAVAVESQDHRK